LHYQYLGSTASNYGLNDELQKFRGNCRDLIEILFRNFLERLKRSVETTRTSGVPAEIRTETKSEALLLRGELNYSGLPFEGVQWIYIELERHQGLFLASMVPYNAESILISRGHITY
jgi:hypothetical protein